MQIKTIKLKFPTFYFMISSLLLLFLIITILGLLFSSKRNSYGFFISENINSSDPQSRLESSIQTNTIELFLREISSKKVVEERPSCEKDIKANYRERSDVYFFLPNGFRYKFGTFLISNGDEASILFLDSKSKESDVIYLSNCENFWLISGG